MPLDPSQHTTSEWFERTLMVVGVALFFAALLVTGPLTGMLGVLDDPGGERAVSNNDSNDSVDSTSGEAAITDSGETDDRSGDASPEQTQSERTATADSSDGDDGVNVQVGGPDEEGDEEEEREEESEDEDEDDENDDEDEEDGPPGEAKGHGDERGNGNGRGGN